MLIDVHTHTQFAAFKGDYKEVIERALKAGVHIINVGTQRDTSKRAVEIAHEFPNGIYASVGLHPIHTEKSYHDIQELGDNQEAKGFVSRGEDFDYEYYKKLASDPKVVAIGECGLDYYRIMNDELRIKEKQKQVFLEQIKLAQDLQKPLMIHCRPSKDKDDAYEDLLSIIHDSKFVIHKVVHFYVGSLAITKKLVQAGFFFTFGGVITFARDYNEVIRYIPLDRILSETDAPYVTPEPYRGKRNEPAYIVETAKKLAEIKGVSFEYVTKQTLKNAKQVFRLN